MGILLWCLLLLACYLPAIEVAPATSTPANTVAVPLMREKIMSPILCGVSISPTQFAQLSTTLVSATEEADSLDAFIHWLETQPCVKSLNLADYLVKTHPPLRELFVEFRMDDGSLRPAAIDIAVLVTGKIQFKAMHDVQ